LYTYAPAITEIAEKSKKTASSRFLSRLNLRGFFIFRSVYPQVTSLPENISKFYYFSNCLKNFFKQFDFFRGKIYFREKFPSP